MNLSSPWISLAPLLAFNVVLLSTVLLFRPVYRSQGRMKEIEERYASKFLNRWMREYWLWLTDPFVRFFCRVGISPNQLTVIGVGLSFVSGYFFWKGHLGLGGWFMIFSATFDIFDGRVARVTKQETKSGAYLDSVMDRVSEGAIFFGLALFYRNHFALWIVIIALIGSTMVSYAKARGDADGVRYLGGAMQRPERIVYLGVSAIFSPLFSWFLSIPFPSLSASNLYLFPLTFVAIMTWMTSVDRVKHVMTLLDKKG